jgi:hypothetical protein
MKEDEVNTGPPGSPCLFVLKPDRFHSYPRQQVRIFMTMARGRVPGRGWDVFQGCRGGHTYFSIVFTEGGKAPPRYLSICCVFLNWRMTGAGRKTSTNPAITRLLET